MKSNINNHVQLNVLVPRDTKNQLTEISAILGIKPHSVVEMALARLHADIKQPSGRSQSVIQILHRLESKIDSLHDES